jgi:hypothetical protein
MKYFGTIDKLKECSRVANSKTTQAIQKETFSQGFVGFLVVKYIATNEMIKNR